MKKQIILSIIIGTVLLAGGLIFVRFADAQTLAERLKGLILLQVESNGEAWYMNPSDDKRYYMGRAEDAFELMKNLGVGIHTRDLDKIPLGLLDETFGIDTDGDGLSDNIEDALGTNKEAKDTDLDGYDDKIEACYGYNPLGAGKWNKADTDRDGLADILEDALGTDKFNADTDGDGFDDGMEFKNGYSPLGNDTDRDGLEDKLEDALGTNKYAADSDRDGYSDLKEVMSGYDPVSAVRGKMTVDNYGEQYKGKILLQVESHGEAWYINPNDNKRYFLGRPSDAFRVMRLLSLGVRNDDLAKIGLGSVSDILEEREAARLAAEQAAQEAAQEEAAEQEVQAPEAEEEEYVPIEAGQETEGDEYAPIDEGHDVEVPEYIVI